MIYQQVKGELVLAQVISDYNIDSSDWIAKSPKWIQDCLSDLRILSEMELQKETITVIDNKVLLPCEIKSLETVEYNGYEITREEITTNKSTHLTYQLLHDSYIKFPDEVYFTNGDTVTIYWKGYRTSLSTKYNIFMPDVPDNQDVINACAVYILLKYLHHGYTHSVFNLRESSPYTNPAVMYAGFDGKSGLKLIARNSAKTLDKAEMDYISARASTLNENPISRTKLKFKRNV